MVPPARVWPGEPLEKLVRPSVATRPLCSCSILRGFWGFSGAFDGPVASCPATWTVLESWPPAYRSRKRQSPHLFHDASDGQHLGLGRPSLAPGRPFRHLPLPVRAPGFEADFDRHAQPPYTHCWPSQLARPDHTRRRNRSPVITFRRGRQITSVWPRDKWAVAMGVDLPIYGRARRNHGRPLRKRTRRISASRTYNHPMPDSMGAAARHSQGVCPLVFSTELAREVGSDGIHYGHINARCNGDLLIIAQRKEVPTAKKTWYSFALPYPGPFGNH